MLTRRDLVVLGVDAVTALGNESLAVVAAHKDVQSEAVLVGAGTVRVRVEDLGGLLDDDDTSGSHSLAGHRVQGGSDGDGGGDGLVDDDDLVGQDGGGEKGDSSDKVHGMGVGYRWGSLKQDRPNL